MTIALYIMSVTVFVAAIAEAVLGDIHGATTAFLGVCVMLLMIRVRRLEEKG